MEGLARELYSVRWSWGKEKRNEAKLDVGKG